MDTSLTKTKKLQARNLKAGRNEDESLASSPAAWLVTACVLTSPFWGVPAVFLWLVLSVVQMLLFFCYIFSFQEHPRAPTAVKRHYSVWNLWYAPYTNFIHSFHLSRAPFILFLWAEHHSFFHPIRARELCESWGGRPGIPIPNGLYGLCGRKATLNFIQSEPPHATPKWQTTLWHLSYLETLLVQGYTVQQ